MDAFFWFYWCRLQELKHSYIICVCNTYETRERKLVGLMEFTSFHQGQKRLEINLPGTDLFVDFRELFVAISGTVHPLHSKTF